MLNASVATSAAARSWPAMNSDMARCVMVAADSADSPWLRHSTMAVAKLVVASSRAPVQPCAAPSSISSSGNAWVSAPVISSCSTRSATTCWARSMDASIDSSPSLARQRWEHATWARLGPEESGGVPRPSGAPATMRPVQCWIPCGSSASQRSRATANQVDG